MADDLLPGARLPAPNAKIDGATLSASPKIFLSIIGCGHWGRNYVRVFNGLRRCQIQFCYDLDPARLAFIRDQYPSVRISQSLEQVLEDRQTQAVIVSTPAASHFRIAKQCLDAGKDVLIEKPLALTVHDAEELTGIAQRKGRILMVGHTFLYNMSLRKTKELIDRAEIGKIYYIKAV